MRMRRSHRAPGHARRDLFGAAAEHVDRRQPVLGGERFEATLKVLVHAAIMARGSVDAGRPP